MGWGARGCWPGQDPFFRIPEAGGAEAILSNHVPEPRWVGQPVLGEDCGQEGPSRQMVATDVRRGLLASIQKERVWGGAWLGIHVVWGCDLQTPPAPCWTLPCTGYHRGLCHLFLSPSPPAGPVSCEVSVQVGSCSFSC